MSLKRDRAMTDRGWRTLAVTATASLLVGCGVSNPYATAPAPTTTAATTTTIATASRPGGGRALTAAQINRQDHRPGALVRRQRTATRGRPMLPALPITSRGVRIAIGGLARDGQTTILTLTTSRGRAHALRVYHRELRRYGDDGHAYRLRVRP
jgi:hypothetical protein